MNKNHGAEQVPHILMPDGTLHPIPAPPQRRQRRPENFYMGFQDANIEAATRKDLKGNDLRLLLFLQGTADYENWITVTAADMSEALGIHRTHIYHGLTRLRKAGILEHVPSNPGHRAGWRFAPSFLWRGKVKNLHEERKRRLQAVTAKPVQEEA